MSYHVKLTATARQDLKNIAFYIFKQSGSKEIPSTFINELKDKVNLLSEFPYRGSFPSNHVAKSLGYRFLVHGDYLMFYAVDEDKKIVNVLTFIHAKRDYSRVLNELF